MKPEQGSLDLLDDEVAKRLLTSGEVAHLAYQWTDGTPRCTPIWFHWNGTELVMASPANAPKARMSRLIHDVRMPMSARNA